MTPRILVVDDEPDLVDLLRVNLERAGMRVETVGSGARALERIRTALPDLVILDLMLPDLSGEDVCRRIRSDDRTRDLPVIMVTAKSDEVDRVVGLELGADDYITKPFSPREMTLRVKAVLRRRGETSGAPRALERGALRLDPESHRCWVDGERIDLTAKEFGLLQSLMIRPGIVKSRERLLDEVWGSDITVTPRTVDTHLKRLREKLGTAGSLVETVRGFGYRFAD